MDQALHEVGDREAIWSTVPDLKPLTFWWGRWPSSKAN